MAAKVAVEEKVKAKAKAKEKEKVVVGQLVGPLLMGKASDYKVCALIFVIKANVFVMNAPSCMWTRRGGRGLRQRENFKKLDNPLSG